MKAIRQTRNFLLSRRSREFFVFLFFLLLAGTFWLLQTLNDDYETEFSIPVRLADVPRSVVVTTEPAAQLRVRVKDKGTVLLNYLLGKSFYPVVLHFDDYTPAAGSHVSIPVQQFEKKLQSQLAASTRLLSVEPDTLEYIYTTGRSKLVPVRLQGKLGAGRQYYLSDTLFRPDSVLAYAPDDVLGNLSAALTQPVQLLDVTDTVRLTVPLHAERGVKFVPATVELTLPVDVYTEKSVEVPLQGAGFPAGKVLRAFPSKIQVTFSVGMSRYRSVSADDFLLLVSYEELLRLGSGKYTVRPVRLPQGVSHVRFNPPQVDFLIEQTTTE